MALCDYSLDGVFCGAGMKNKHIWMELEKFWVGIGKNYHSSYPLWEMMERSRPVECKIVKWNLADGIFNAYTNSKKYRTWIHMLKRNIGCTCPCFEHKKMCKHIFRLAGEIQCRVFPNQFWDTGEEITNLNQEYNSVWAHRLTEHFIPF